MESEAGETFLLRCKAKLTQDVPYKFCLISYIRKTTLSELSVFCEVPAMSPESGQRPIASTTKIDDAAKMFISLELWSAGDITRQLQYSEFLGERHPSSPSRSQHPVRDLCVIPWISFHGWHACSQKTICAIFCWNSEGSANVLFKHFFAILSATSRVRRWRKHGLYRAQCINLINSQDSLKSRCSKTYLQIFIHDTYTQCTHKWNAHKCQKRNDI